MQYDDLSGGMNMTLTFDAIEKNTFEQKAVDIGERMRSLHSSFQKSLSPEGKTFSGPENLSFDRSITDLFGLRGVEITPEVRAGAVRTVKDMYYGKEVNGSNSLGLKKISSWKISPENRKANLNQHAGFAAEVISTAKENYISEAKHTGDMTYRADDIPAGLRDKLSEKGVNIARKNDLFIDKVRVRADGTIETVQTKFVGKDAGSCLSRLMSKRFEKYLDNSAVDKIEVPKEYYDDLKTSISIKKKDLCKQYGDVVGAADKVDDAEKIKRNIQKLDKLKEKTEPSVVTKTEALSAVENPKIYAAKQINNRGLREGAQAAAFTAVISGVSNFERFRSGDISGTEAVSNIVKETAVSGAIGYGTGVITEVMGGSCIPAAVITMGVESYDDLIDYAKGDISGEKLAYNLGENAISIIGGTVGGVVGAVVGPVGTIGGAVAGSYCAIQLYHESVEFVTDHIDDVVEFGSDVVDKAGDLKDAAVEKAVEVGEDIKEFAVDTADYIADGAVKVGKGIQKGAKKAKAAVVKKVKGIFD